MQLKPSKVPRWVYQCKYWVCPQVSYGNLHWCTFFTIHAPAGISKFFGRGTLGLYLFKYQKLKK